MQKRPRIAVVPVLGVWIAALALWTGCIASPAGLVGGSEHNSPTQMVMNYDEFTGSREVHLLVDEEQPMAVVVAITTNSGELDAWIASPDGETEAYEGRSVPTSTFTVTLKDSGRYTIRVAARRHSGGYSFVWGEA